MKANLSSLRVASAAACAAGLALGCSSGSSTTLASKAGDAGDAGEAGGRRSECQTFEPGQESRIVSAVATTQDDACIALAQGTYRFQDQLAFGMGDRVTFKGAGMGKTILDMSGQVAGDDGLFAQSVADLTLQGFTVENTPNNAIKTLSVTGVTFDSIEVTWTGKNSSQHGAYGLYPVSSKNVLIQNSKIGGASDSGVYVGQSQHIVVRDNETFGNVAGIEIENSFYAEVYGNHTHDNAAGLLVFALPNLPQDSGKSILVHDNTVENNNGKNFAAKGDIVSILPSGTGSIVMACEDVEFYGNTYTGNQTGSFGILSYYASQLPFTDKNYDPYPSRIYVHDNLFDGNGNLPDFRATFGLLLLSALSSFPGMQVPDVIWDGLVDSKASGGSPTNPMQICVPEPTVCDLTLGKFDMKNPNLPQIMVCSPPTQPAILDCTLPHVPRVTLPGLTK